MDTGCRNQSKYAFFRRPAGYLLLLGALAAAAVLACLLGSTPLSLPQLWDGLRLAQGYETVSVILYYLRLPRMLAGLIAGAGLAVSGALLQSVTGNALASPNTIGVNAGAGFCCIALLSCFPALWSLLPAVSFLGAFATTLLILLLAARIGSSAHTVILAGIACTSLLNAGISFLSLLDTDVLSAYNAFSIGSLAGVQAERLILPGVIVFTCYVVSMLHSRQIRLLCLGEAMAASLGVRVRYVRLICLVCASACAAAVVSFAGLLGFVGLIVPHIARKLCGDDTAPLLTVSALLGSILVLLADTLGRILIAPAQIPVGILMALIGVPFFFFLLLKRRTVYADM